MDADKASDLGRAESHEHPQDYVNGFNPYEPDYDDQGITCGVLTTIVVPSGSDANLDTALSALVIQDTRRPGVPGFVD